MVLFTCKRLRLEVTASDNGVLHLCRESQGADRLVQVRRQRREVQDHLPQNHVMLKSPYLDPELTKVFEFPLSEFCNKYVS
jgi:hypothetical protein